MRRRQEDTGMEGEQEIEGDLITYSEVKRQIAHLKELRDDYLWRRERSHLLKGYYSRKIKSIGERLDLYGNLFK